MIKVIRVFLLERIIYIFRHFPQVQIHTQAQRAAQAAQAATSKVGQFWMHDTLFIHQKLENGYLVEYANLGLDPSVSQDLPKQVQIDRINRRYRRWMQEWSNGCSSPIYQ